MNGLLQVDQELLPERTIEPPLLSEGFDGGGIRIGAEHQTRGIARHVKNKEDAGREEKERKERTTHNAKNKCGHGLCLRLVREG